ncbi:PilZ domain-containing protein [Legionella gresilensis]|uniref:PilZ domain-containing protein n=1 Tax=Legionella gresilensis TaxID=91823 RepID=UPI001041430B|nr:PilZ domain-containing protein [Legionella gresilensis]
MIDVPIVNGDFPTEAALYMAYMPFIKGGGLFIRTNLTLPLGGKVKLSIKLIDEPDPYVIPAKVAWITPRGSQGNKPAGLGFQFQGEDARVLKNKIETYLTTMLKSTQITDTL